MTRKPQPKRIASSDPIRSELPGAAHVPEQRVKTMRSDRQEFFLPVTGFAWFYPEEVKVIDHPAFQRLGRINQLGQCSLVFRGATHKRIEHVLGAVHIVQRMIAAVSANQEKLMKLHGVASAELSDAEQRFVRLGTLLHDIGHLAAGHTFEDELGICGAHDADKRLQLLFTLPPSAFDAEGDETLEQVVDTQYDVYLQSGMSNPAFSPSELVRLLIRKNLTSGTDISSDEERYQTLSQELSKSNDIRLDVCSNMIGNTICADLLDYIYRDWYHLGKPRSFEDRIFQYMEVRSLDPKDKQPNKDEKGRPAFRRSFNDRFVVSLGASPKIRSDGVSAILSLLEWRYELAETALFHKTKIAAAAMLDRAVYELWEKKNEDEIINEVLVLSDEQVIDHCLDQAKSERNGTVSAERADALDAALSNLRGIKNRQLKSNFRTWTVDNLGVDQIEEIKQLYGGDGYVSKECAVRRSQVLRNLEKDFKLPAGSLAMYCAEAKPKIAEVVVAVGNRIQKFDEYERLTDGRLTGGHLEAQKRRFRRLWRVAFFIHRDKKKEWAKNGLLITLQNVIESLVFPKGDIEARIRESYAFAQAWINDGRLEWANHEISCDDSNLVAEAKGLEAYPTGAPCIRSFLRPKK